MTFVDAFVVTSSLSSVLSLLFLVVSSSGVSSAVQVSWDLRTHFVLLRRHDGGGRHRQTRRLTHAKQIAARTRLKSAGHTFPRQEEGGCASYKLILSLLLPAKKPVKLVLKYQFKLFCRLSHKVCLRGAKIHRHRVYSSNFAIYFLLVQLRVKSSLKLRVVK